MRHAAEVAAPRWRRRAVAIASSLVGRGLAIGVAIATVFSLFLVNDLTKTQGHPREHVVVVAAKDSGERCGGRGGGTEVMYHWRSSEPPEGFPADFVTEDCGGWSVGDTAVAVRLPRIDRPVDIVIDPVSSWAEVGLAWLVIVFCCVVLFGIVALGSAVWNRIRPDWWPEQQPPRHPTVEELQASLPPEMAAERVVDWLERHLTAAQVAGARAALAAGEPIRAIECVLDGLADNEVTVSGHDRSVLTTYGCASVLSPRGRAVLASVVGGPAETVDSPEPTH